MQKVIFDYVQGLVCGDEQVYGNLNAVPLILKEESYLDYLLLDEAMESKALKVTEVDEDGEVQVLLARNDSDKPVLILAGEELVGAKQNRIINTTVLIPSKSQVSLPASCVERGRWQWKRKWFLSEKRISPPGLRQQTSSSVSKSVKSAKGFMSDQPKIWKEVDEYLEKTNSTSPTGEMAASYRAMDKELAFFEKAFNPVSGQIGAIIAIDGKFIGLDAFNCNETFKKLHDKLLRSYTMEAVTSRREKQTKGKNAILKPGQIMDEVRNARFLIHDSPGTGKDIRIEGEKLEGHALVVDGQVLHLCLFERSIQTESQEEEYFYSFDLFSLIMDEEQED